MTKTGKRRRGLAPGAEHWNACRAELIEEMLELGFVAEDAEAEARRRMARIRIRIEWASERFDAFLDMQDKAGEAYARLFDAYPGIDWESADAPRLPEPPEEVVAQAIYAEVMAAVEEDRWPRHLHFPNV